MNPAARAAQLFGDTFGKAPAALATAPGRVNLIGEHVDYHGGHVLPAAIAERTAVAVGPGRGFAAVSEGRAVAQGDWPPAHAGTWSDYVAGVALYLAERVPGGGLPGGGIALAVASDVPVGSGLSSSAALEVATAAALASCWRLDLDGRALAAVAHRSETEFVGVPCGVMDQMASALAPEGGALLIDCATLETGTVAAGVELVVVDSGESHALRAGAYAERRREGNEAMALLRRAFPRLAHLVDLPFDRLDEAVTPLSAVLAKRVRHVVEEDRRAVEAARALEVGDLARFGALVNASHDSLRDLYECSTRRLDEIVAGARRVPGVLGARLVGAGWGGSALVAVEPGRGAEVSAALRRLPGIPAEAVRLERLGSGVRLERQ